MKHPIYSFAIALLLSLSCSAAFALLAEEVEVAPGQTVDLGLDVDECAFPEPPVIPDGATAPESALARAGAEVRGYKEAVEASLACIDEVQTALGEEATREQTSALNVLYNNGVEQLTMIAESFNQQVRVFKARPPSESVSDSE